ncbi:MAG: hypothetical protein H0T79_09360 [Deltaproteobacteria bacterium]|nr:hypothetical protein [Deltaproteobacteria bacterium]
MRITAGLLALVASVGTAAAQVSPTKAAEATFAKGRDLMKQQKFALACEAFEQSQQLDPQYGTQYNLAGCYVELGKLATAWNLYRELARGDNNPSRRQASQDAATALQSRVPKLLLEIEARPADATIVMNDRDASAFVGVETPVDFGRYTFVISAAGFATWQSTVEVKHEGSIEHVVVTLVRRGDPSREPVLPPSGVTSTPTAPLLDDRGATKRTYGKVVVAGGAGLVALGLGFGAVALVKWNDAKDRSLESSADANTQVDSARMFGNVSTGFVAVGLLAVAGGLYLWRTAPDAPTLQASVGPSSAGLVIAGPF